MFLTPSLVLLLSSIPAFAVDAGDVVDLGYAKYLGNRTFDNAVAYLGIPYAEPPIGERRFRAPLALNSTRVGEEANGETIDATEYPDFCVQGTIGFGDHGGAGSEDCLTINVYAPVGAKEGDNLPVLFYIHGGGYTSGNPRNWPYDHWIHQSPNVIITSVYYRLDAFGFLSIPEFSDPVYGDSNAGFLDQVQALKWVQEHITAFGGDPSRVTINGESAGGGSVVHHIVSPESEGLFSGAIAQSVARSVTPDPVQKLPLFNYFANAAGCDADTVAEKLGCLRNASISAIARAQDQMAGGPAFNGSYGGFGPVVDGKVIVGHPTTLIREGKYSKVPLVVGATTDESFVSGTDPAGALRSLYPQYTEDDINDVLAAYPESDFESAEARLRDLLGEALLRCAREIMGDAFSQTTKVWTYRYNQANPTTANVIFGVGHAAENWLMFDGSNTGTNGTANFTGLTEVETAFAEELIAYWLSFVRAEDPNTYKLDRSPEWPEWTSSAASLQRIVLQQDPSNSTTTSGSFVEDEPENEHKRCTVLGDKSERSQN